MDDEKENAEEEDDEEEDDKKGKKKKEPLVRCYDGSAEADAMVAEAQRLLRAAQPATDDASSSSSSSSSSSPSSCFVWLDMPVLNPSVVPDEGRSDTSPINGGGGNQGEKDDPYT